MSRVISKPCKKSIKYIIISMINTNQYAQQSEKRIRNASKTTNKQTDADRCVTRTVIANRSVQTQYVHID